MIRIIILGLLLSVDLFAFTQTGNDFYVGQTNSKSISKVPLLRGAVHAAKNSLIVFFSDMTLSLYSSSTFTLQKSFGLQSVRSTAVTFSHDGNYILSAGSDGVVRVWNSANGAFISNIKTDIVSIVGIAVPKANAVLVAGADGKLKMFEIVGGREVSSYSPSVRDVTSMAVDANGTLCALGTLQGSVSIYDLSQSRTVTVLPLTTNRVTTIQFSLNNQYLAAGGTDGSVKVWEIPTWKPIDNISSHQLGISAMAFDARSSWFVSSSLDNSLIVTNLRDRNRKKTIRDEDGYCLFLSFLNDELLCGGTSKGFLKSWKVLEAVPDAAAPVVVLLQPLVTGDTPVAKVFGKEFTFQGIVYDKTEVKKLTFNNVDLTLHDVDPGDASVVPPGMKGKKFSYTMAIDPKNMPSVEIKAYDEWNNIGTLKLKLVYLAGNQSIEVVNPQQETSESEKSSIRIQFKAWFDIASYKIENNLTEIVNRRNVTSGIGELITEEISLVAGFNQISISATSKTGERYSKTLTVNRKLTGLAPPIAANPLQSSSRSKGIEPQKWAVVIGISKYLDPNIPPLKFADADARAYAEFLQTPEGGGFEPDHMRVLINEDATVANVKDAMYNFLLQAIDIDFVIIYFAGHGAPNPLRLDQLYLLTYDSNPNILGTTAFPMWELPTVLEKVIAAKKVVVFSDACHSGGITTDLASTRGLSLTKSNPVNQYLINLNRAKEGFVVFTASDQNEVSQESPEFRHGVFTYYLLDGLKGAADTNNDRLVTINELMTYVEIQVKRYTKGAQNPVRSQTRYDKNLPMSILSK